MRIWRRNSGKQGRGSESCRPRRAIAPSAGMRISLYNAVGLDAVEALTHFMKEF